MSTTYTLYELADGDVLLVPTSAKVERYAPATGGPSTNGTGPKQRHARHPRTPKKYWERRRLVMEKGTVAAAAILGGVTHGALAQMARHYGWKYPKYKRGG